MTTEAKHARLGPSNHRWPHCPGSVREEAAYPDIPGEAAIDGTGSHLLLEMCLNNGVRAEVYDQQIIGANHPEHPSGWLVGTERIVRVQMCLDYLASRVKELQGMFPGSKVIVEAESRSDPGGAFGRTDWWGTCDITITVVNTHNKLMHMEVIDYKDGRGYVDARNNTQLESYLFGKLRPFIGAGPDLVRPFNTVAVHGNLRMTIVQPKIEGKVVRKEEVSLMELVERAEKLSAAARWTDQPDAPLIPDNKGGNGYCRWCKHKPNCTAQGEKGLEEIKAMSTELQVVDGNLFELAGQALGNVSNMSNEQLTKLIDAEPGIMSVFDKAREELEDRLSKGDHIPGWQMLPGRGANVWNDSEEAIVKALKGRRLKLDEIMPRKLASPAQILKSNNLKPEQKERIEKELVTHKVGSNKLTRVSHQVEDKSTEVMFADVGKETPTVDFFTPPSFL